MTNLIPGGAGGAKAFLLLVAASSPAVAGSSDGTWTLASRTLADGKELKSPAVHGMSTFKNGINQLIVVWPTPDGKSGSVSSLSKWEFKANAIIATPIVSIFDEGKGAPPVYTLGGDPKTVPVKRTGSTISYHHPLDPPEIVRKGDDFDAEVKGVFVDHWKKVK